VVNIKVVLSLLTSGIVIVSFLLFLGVFQRGVSELIVSAGEVVLSDETDILSFSNKTVSDLGGMQSTVREMYESLSDIFS